MKQSTEQQGSGAAEQQSLVQKSLSAALLRYCATALIILFTFYFQLSTSFADDISSKAAVVMDASTGRVLFAKNLTLKLPPASTTKLVTAMVVLDRAGLKEVVNISEKASQVPTLKGTRFNEGETATVETLLYAALLRSSNEAAFALAEHVAGSEEKFVGMMNKKAIAIGAINTRFINTTGLPGKGQKITAYDLAKIMRHALKYPMIREIIGTKEAELTTGEGRIMSYENTNKLLWSDDGAVGGKTGYTRAARHCFVYACEKQDGMLIVAILGANSRKMLWDETEKLMEKGLYIIASNDQSQVYFTKADYEISAEKAVYKKSPRTKKYYNSKKVKTAKATAKKRHAVGQAKKKDIQSPAKQSRKNKEANMAWDYSGAIEG